MVLPEALLRRGLDSKLSVVRGRVFDVIYNLTVHAELLYPSQTTTIDIEAKVSMQASLTCYLQITLDTWPFFLQRDTPSGSKAHYCAVKISQDRQFPLPITKNHALIGANLYNKY